MTPEATSRERLSKDELYVLRAVKKKLQQLSFIFKTEALWRLGTPPRSIDLFDTSGRGLNGMQVVELLNRHCQLWTDFKDKMSARGYVAYLHPNALVTIQIRRQSDVKLTVS